jgi:hypothetical protein
MQVRLPTMMCSLIFCGLLRAQEGAQRLRDVHRIYVDSFGAEDGAEAIRSKIITGLGKVRRFEIVQAADQADAVLTGASRISKGPRRPANGQAPNSSGANRFHVTADARLVSKDQETLWADDASIAAPSHFGATSSMADRIVKDLLKAISKEAKSRSSGALADQRD